MTGIPIINHLSSIGIQERPQCSLIADFIIVGFKSGSLLVYDLDLHLLKSLNLFNNPIDSIVSFNNHYSILSNGEVSILDSEFNIMEVLPFKLINHQLNSNNKLYLSTRNLILNYDFIKDSLEMVSKYKLNDKVIKFLIIDNEIIWSNGYSFFKYSISSNESIQLPFNSKYSIFNQPVNILKIDSNILLSRGKEVSIVNDLEQIDSFQWLNSPVNIIQYKPFLAFNTENHLFIKDTKNFHTYQNLNLVGIEKIISNRDLLIILTNSSIQLFKFNSFESIVDSIKDLDQSIDLLSQLSTDQYPNKLLKLRDLNIKLGLKFLLNHKFNKAFDKFIEFVAPPFQIIKLFPTELTGYNEGISSSLEKFKPSVNLLINYITDQRRKLNKLINNNYEDLKLEFFTEDKYSIDQVLELLDTTLFNIYIESNPGLIGSLVRVDNHLNYSIVDKLISKNMINELIDFYFKKNLHDKALMKLSELSSNEKMIKYLSRLSNAQLDLIFEYSKPLIQKDLKIGELIFIDSVNSNELDPIKVNKFINSISIDLELKHLEFIILEYKNTNISLNKRLFQIYLLFFSDIEFDESSIYYQKLQDFLHKCNYEFELIDEIDKLKEENKPLLNLKILIYNKFKKHTESLKLIIFKLNPEDSISYLLNIEENIEPYYLNTLEFLINVNRIDILLKVLSLNISKTVSILKILKIINTNLKIHDLKNFLILNINETIKLNNYTQLKKNLNYLNSINYQIEYHNLIDFKITENDICSICNKNLNSLIYVINENNSFKSIHFNCLETYKNTITKPKKLKSIKLSDYKSSSS